MHQFFQKRPSLNDYIPLLDNYIEHSQLLIKGYSLVRKQPPKEFYQELLLAKKNEEMAKSALLKIIKNKGITNEEYTSLMKIPVLKIDTRISGYDKILETNSYKILITFE